MSCIDYIFEAVALFLYEYFELDLNTDSFLADVELYYAIEDELTYLASSCPAYLKPKQRLLKVWSEIMPRYNRMVSDLDFKILHAADPAMKDVKAPSETSDPEEMLRNLIKLNPDIIPDLIRLMAKTDFPIDREEDESRKETPYFIDNVVKRWEQTEIDANTPTDLLAAYCRFDRAWNSFRGAVRCDMVGQVCTEYFRRTDHLGWVIDRKIHASKSLEEQVMLIGLFRLLIPQYIDHGEEKRNMEYERWWCKHLAEQTAQSGILSPARAELLVHIREDFKRLPASLSKFIKGNMPKYLDDEVREISEESIRDLNCLKSAIRNLDSFIQWTINVEESKKNISKITDPCFDLISDAMENVSDINAWLFFSNLMTTCYAPSGTIKDRRDFEKRVTDRLEKLIKSEKNIGSKRKKEVLIEELLLASSKPLIFHLAA